MATEISNVDTAIESMRHKMLALGQEPAAQVEYPLEPKNLDELGLDDTLVHKFILKHLYTRGTLRTDELATHLGIPVTLLDDPITFLRNQALLQTYRRDSSFIGDIMRYKLTENGRSLAQAHMKENSYCGRLPVNYQTYCEQIARQSVKNVVVKRAQLEEIFKNIVINKDVLTGIGSAFNSGSSIFLYGPPGTGKTFLASQLQRLLQGNIVVPYALEVEGQIIQIHDPNNFKPIEEPEQDTNLFHSGVMLDQRWVICKRPVIVAAGELTLDMLELDYLKDRGFYEAPLQMKANGGLFIIDDLGRQKMSSTFLLNRWIMPLENGVDFLGLHTGNKVQIPFDVIPVFSTNIHPNELVDDAFLRRLGYKIIIDYVDKAEYSQIFEQYCLINDLAYDAKYVNYLIEHHYKPHNMRLLASHPKELINKVIDLALFEGVTPVLSEEMLDLAWKSFFIHETV